MDFQIGLFLVQDGATNGAIYAMLALALVLVFSVTRVIFIPQGEFVAYGALTLASLQGGHIPATLWLLVVISTITALIELWRCWRNGISVELPTIGWLVGYPLIVTLLLWYLPLASLPSLVQVVAVLAVVVPLGPLMYRLVYQPIAEASVLILLIVSVAIHVVLVGLGLLFFGAEGSRSASFTDISFELGPLLINGQQGLVILVAIGLIVGLWRLFFGTLYGKALRATAMNRTGARLMGFSPVFAGKLSFLLSAFIGTLCGVLIAPITTIYYDTGFLIGLKGFVAAIVGGLVSFPVAAAGAVLVGLLESFASFFASAYKEVIVFTLIIPVLLWRSLTSHHIEEE